MIVLQGIGQSPPTLPGGLQLPAECVRDMSSPACQQLMAECASDDPTANQKCMDRLTGHARSGAGQRNPLLVGGALALVGLAVVAIIVTRSA